MSRYAQAGVDLAAAEEATARIREAVRSTHGPEVLAGVGSFGGMFDASALRGMAAPVLVSSTDGVGTKTMVAARLGRWDTLGQDLVNHCVNDILVCGARPLFFLDYVASSRLDPSQVEAVVGGVAAACREVGCALVGGETAEMPGVYREGELDLVGTIVGVVERLEVLDGSAVRPGDPIRAWPSGGLHTNGYSLARRALDGLDWSEPREDLGGVSVGEALLAVHRCYLQPVMAARDRIRALCHVTGGGVEGNLPRVLPAGLGAEIRLGSWPVPPIFELIRRVGEVEEAEMRRVFNMGLGMLAVAAGSIEGTFEVGRVVGGPGVRFVAG